METPNVRTVRVGKAKVSEYQPVAEHQNRLLKSSDVKVGRPQLKQM